jgi:hypothetical protein
MDIEIKSRENYYLSKLNKYLRYELSSPILFFGGYFIGPLIFLAYAVAIIFTPYMLYVLFQLKKTGWIITFFAIVVIPAVIFWSLGLKLGYTSIFMLIPLGLCYFYFFILKYTVSDRLRELENRLELEAKRKAAKKEQQQWEMQFKDKD